MGFKEYIFGKEKPVTERSLLTLFYSICGVLLAYILIDGYLERKHIKNIHQNEIRRDDETAKINREIREDQHKFNIRIQKEINTLKKNCKVDKK